MGAASDGGYLGSDFEAFVSAVKSGGPGVYTGKLMHDVHMDDGFRAEYGQRVIISGDASLSEPPVWSGGNILLQQQGSLSLTFVALGADSTWSTGEFFVPVTISATRSDALLSLARMAVPLEVLARLLTQATTGFELQLSEVTVQDSGQDHSNPIIPDIIGPLTGSVTMGADGALVYDPPDLLPGVRAPLPAATLRPPSSSGSPLVNSLETTLLAHLALLPHLLRCAWLL